MIKFAFWLGISGLVFISCDRGDSIEGRYQLNSIPGHSVIYVEIKKKDEGIYQLIELDVGATNRIDELSVWEDDLLRGIIRSPKKEHPLEMILSFEKRNSRMIQTYQYHGEILYQRFYRRVK